MEETNFDDWWNNGGSEYWDKTLDQMGLLKALELVFMAGQIAQSNKIISKLREQEDSQGVMK